MLDDHDGPDVVAELLGVRSPAQEGRSGEEETPEPAGQHQTPGQSSTVELTLVQWRSVLSLRLNLILIQSFTLSKYFLGLRKWHKRNISTL